MSYSSEVVHLQQLEQLQPSEAGIGRRSSVVPRLRIEESSVTVAKQHVEAVLSYEVVLLAPRIVFVPIRPPRPVALHKFVGRTASDLGCFHRGETRGRQGFSAIC